MPGFCKAATLEDIRGHGHVLTPGRYVGAEDVEDDGEPFEEKMTRLRDEWREQQAEAARLDAAIRANLRGLGFGRLIGRQVALGEASRRCRLDTAPSLTTRVLGDPIVLRSPNIAAGVSTSDGWPHRRALTYERTESDGQIRCGRVTCVRASDGTYG